jgi:hypothetical protein
LNVCEELRRTKVCESLCGDRENGNAAVIIRRRSKRRER